MYISIVGPDPDDFDAKSAVKRWWGSGKRARRPGFSAWTGRQQEPTEEELEAELDALDAALDSESLLTSEDSDNHADVTLDDV